MKVNMGPAVNFGVQMDVNAAYFENLILGFDNFSSAAHITESFSILKLSKF